MNDTTTPETSFVSWRDVDAAIGKAASNDLKSGLLRARRWRIAAEIIAVLGGIALLATVLTSVLSRL